MNYIETLKGLASKDKRVQKLAQEAFVKEMTPIFETIDKITPEMTASVYADVAVLLNKHNIELTFSDSHETKVTRNF